MKKGSFRPVADWGICGRLLTVWFMACLTLGAPWLSAATFFVSNTGDNTRTAAEAQNPATPWKTITRAINETTLTSGDTIQVAAGLYDTVGGESFPLFLVDGVQILGAGPGSTTVAAPEFVRAFFNFDSLSSSTRLSGFKFMHEGTTGFFELVGFFVGAGVVMAPRIDNNVFQAIAGANSETGIRYDDGFGDSQFTALIENNTFTGFNFGGIVGQQTSGGTAADIFSPTIRQNTFTSNQTGILFDIGFGEVGGGGGTTAPTISDNTFDTNLNDIQINSFLLPDFIRLAPTITNNTFTGTGGPSIFFNIDFSSGSHTVDPTIGPNIFMSPSRAVLFDVNASGFPTGPTGNKTLAPLISGNSVTNAGFNAIEIDMSELAFDPSATFTFSPSISNNTITGSGFNGVSVDISWSTGANFVSDTTISGNMIAGSAQQGIFFDFGWQCCSSLFDFGLTVANNTIDGSVQNGIDVQLTGLSGNTSGQLDLAVTGNEVLNNGGNAINLFGSGYLDSTLSQSILINNNTVTDNLSSGIALTLLDQTSLIANDVQITNNDLSSNGLEGLVLFAQDWKPDGVPTNAVLVSCNTITGNGGLGAVQQSVNGPPADFGGGNRSSPGRNHLFGNSGAFDLANFDLEPMKAENNWWGNTDPATIDARISDDNEGPYGAVDFDPFLSAPLACALAADLRVVKDDLADPVTLGQNIQYLITVNNAGPDAASGVSLVDSLPLGTNFASVSPSQGSCTPSVGMVFCSLGTIASGAAATVNLSVTPTAAGTYVNSASVSATEPDPVSTNNSESESTSVVAVVSATADLHVRKTVSPTEIFSGGTVLYDIVVTNQGPATATEVQLEDHLPPGAVAQSAETEEGSCSGTSIVTCNLDDLGPGQRARITIAATLIGSGVMTNFASVQAAETDPDRRNNRSAVNVLVLGRDLQVQKSGPATVSPGDSISYVIEVRNASDLQVNGVIVRDLFPSDLIGSSWSCAVSPGGSCLPQSGFGSSIDATVDLPPGGTATFTVAGQVSLSGATNLVNVATITPPPGFVDANSANNSARSEARISFQGCPRDYQPLVGVIPRNLTGIPFFVVLHNPLHNRPGTYEFQLSEDAEDFSNAQSVTVSAGAGVEVKAGFTRTATEENKPFYARGRSLDCNPDVWSPVVQIVIVVEPDTFESDPQFTAQENTTELLKGKITFDAPDGSSGARTALNGDTTVTITTDKTHLTVTPTSTTVPAGGNATVTVTASPTGLPLGTTTGTVLVTNPTSGATTAIPVTVTLTTPLVPLGKGPAPPNALIVPVVAHAQGVNSRWVSDLRMTNTALVPIQYLLTLTPSDQDGTEQGKQGQITLVPAQTLAFDNVAEHQFGIGALGESGSGVLEIRPLSFLGKNSQAVGNKTFLATIAASRTYNQAGGGTVSQFIPGIPFFKAVRQPEPGRRSILSIQHVTQSEESRTNFGFVEGSGQKATVQVRVFNLAGELLDQFTVQLQPAEHKQLNSILANRNVTLQEGRAEMEVTSSTGQILGYASVVTGETNDPLFVSGVDLSQVASNRFVLPGVSDAADVVTTDVRIFNAAATPARATLAFYRLNESAAARTATIDIAPGQVMVLDDILPTTFGEPNTTGTIQVNTAESLPLVVSARTRTSDEAGATSQFIEALTVNDSAGSEDRALQILQIEESERFKSDVGVVEVSGNAVTVEITGVAPDSKLESKMTVELEPNELRQFGSILNQLGLGRVYNGRVAIKVVSGSGRILAYGKLIDAQTGDTTLIPAQ